MAPTDRYIVISSDCHAGGNHAQYREYLDPAYVDGSTPGGAGTRTRSATSRTTAAPATGTTTAASRRPGRRRRRGRGRVPEHGAARSSPPAWSSPRRPTPEELRAAPGRHPGPQPVAGRLLRRRTPPVGPAWARSCSTTSTTRSTTSAGSRPTASPACCCPASRPTPASSRCTHPCTTRCGRCARSSDLPVTHHGGGSGMPDFGAYPSSTTMYMMEAGFFANRALWHLIMSGVFERFPELVFVMTEQGAGWIPGVLEQMDDMNDRPWPPTSSASRGRPPSCCPGPRASTSRRTAGSAPASRPRARPRCSATSASRSSCGAATTRTARAPTATPGSRCAGRSRAGTRRTCAGAVLGERRPGLRLRPRQAPGPRRPRRPDGRRGRHAADRGPRPPAPPSTGPEVLT